MVAEPKLELEKELHGIDSNLWNQLSRIKQAAWDILSCPAIPWYTDHGQQHSEQIARYIFEMLKPLQGGQRLNPPELFVLLAACYLHDIGMWDLRLTGKNYPYSPQDYDEIRHRHPRRSAEMIAENTAYLKNPNRTIDLHIPTDFTDPINQVSLAHSSEYFTDCVAKLAQITQKRGQPFRGPFLAALLLMGDELDLEEIRAKDCLNPVASGLADYPPESLLHIYRHHYITSVEIMHQPAPTRIRLTFQFPQNSIIYAGDLINWVAAKLRRQCRRTQDIFAGQGLPWDAVMAVKRTPDDWNSRRPLPEKALPYLQEMTSFRKVVNREELVTLLKGYLPGNFGPSQALLICGDGDSDCDTLAEWLRYACAVRQEIQYRFLDINSCIENPAPMDIQREIVALRQEVKPGIFVLSGLQTAEEELQLWILGEELGHFLNQAGTTPVAVIMFADQDLQPADQGQMVKHGLPAFTGDQVRRHLEEKLGCPDSQVNLAALTINPGCHPPRYVVSMLNDCQNTWIVE